MTQEEKKASMMSYFAQFVKVVDFFILEFIVIQGINVREIMEKSGNCVKISPNQGTLHF